MGIKSLREKRGLSQAALAAALGVSAPAVCKWEKGLSDPSLANLRALATLLGCTIDELTKESPDPPPIEVAS